MKKLRKRLRRRHVFFSISAILCFIAFITNFIAAFKDCYLDAAELQNLLSLVDGFKSLLMATGFY